MDPESPPMPRDGGDTAPVVSGEETKREIKLLDSGSSSVDSRLEAKKDEIARTRTSAFLDEPPEPARISEGISEQKALVNHVNSGGSLYSPLPTGNLVNVDQELDSVDLDF